MIATGSPSSKPQRSPIANQRRPPLWLTTLQITAMANRRVFVA
jgi:hypothetical protein